VVVHGWVYGLNNGLLEDLRITADSADEVSSVYQAAHAAVKARWQARSEGMRAGI